MSSSPCPAVRWDDLEAWLRDITKTVLPQDPHRSSQEQRDTDLSQFESHDPAQTYSHEQLSKIFGNLALKLVARARDSERSNADLQQKTAALQLQATEALEDRAHTQSRLDQLLFPTEEENATDPKLQKEVERLRNALQDLHLDTDQREQLERKTRKELNERLQ